MSILVMTRDVNDRIADCSEFAKRVEDAIGKFHSKDWGDVYEGDKAQNEQDWEALENGAYGRVLASYPNNLGFDKFWIIRDTEATTILFPHEY